MRLICPKCKAEIPQSNINIEEGISNCSRCNELFRIADYLRSDEEVRRVKKPYYSDIELVQKNDYSTFLIPSAGWNRTTIFTLIFALFWNVFLWNFFINGQAPTLFLIPFYIVGILSFGMFLFALKGKTSVTINRDTITVKWLLFGLGYSKSKQTKGLDKITEDVIYTQNYQPVYGVGLYFKNENKIKFGSKLKEDERKWMIGELYELKYIYNLLNKKN